MSRKKQKVSNYKKNKEAFVTVPMKKGRGDEEKMKKKKKTKRMIEKMKKKRFLRENKLCLPACDIILCSLVKNKMTKSEVVENISHNQQQNRLQICSQVITFKDFLSFHFSFSLSLFKLESLHRSQRQKWKRKQLGLCDFSGKKMFSSIASSSFFSSSFPLHFVLSVFLSFFEIARRS